MLNYQMVSPMRPQILDDFGMFSINFINHLILGVTNFDPYSTHFKKTKLVFFGGLETTTMCGFRQANIRFFATQTWFEATNMWIVWKMTSRTKQWKFKHRYLVLKLKSEDWTATVCFFPFQLSDTKILSSSRWKAVQPEAQPSGSHNIPASWDLSMLEM
jgi:hypothetical protein